MPEDVLYRDFGSSLEIADRPGTGRDLSPNYLKQGGFSGPVGACDGVSRARMKSVVKVLKYPLAVEAFAERIDRNGYADCDPFSMKMISHSLWPNLRSVAFHNAAFRSSNKIYNVVAFRAACDFFLHHFQRF